jgi:hypothetical protein
MWVVAVIGLGALAISWIASRAQPSRAETEREKKRAEHEVAALRCDLEVAVREAQRWFEMDLPKPAWDSISDAFALLELLRSRIDRTEWSALQAQLLDAIPRALDAQPRSTPRTKPRRRLRRKSRSIYV